MKINSNTSSLQDAVYAKFKNTTISDTTIRKLNGVSFRCAGVSNNPINFRYTNENIKQARQNGQLKDFMGLTRFLAIVTELGRALEENFALGRMGLPAHETLSSYLKELDNTIYTAGKRYNFDPTKTTLTREEEFNKLMLWEPD
ncbi:hypothetical protein ACVBEF_07935 [Glaciimonas sp. GG7]